MCDFFEQNITLHTLAGELQVYAPSELREPSTGLGSKTRQNDLCCTIRGSVNCDEL
jgi:hypothetical protein